ncbi:MAG: phospholipase, partial [Alphaproteobacteria bacterium]
GKSAGATSPYGSGLSARAPATPRAPFAASFPPMLPAYAPAARLQRLPIRLVHGARDWMFHVDMARAAAEAFERRGAPIAYVELSDRAHVFPQAEAAPTLDWFLGPPASPRSME